MDFSSRRRRTKAVVTNKLSELYPLDLQMYKTPPDGEISLSEFENLALDRLQLLRILERSNFKGRMMYSDEWRNSIKADLLRENLKCYARLIAPAKNSEPDFEARRADHVSHHILRLVYCRSNQLRQWFIAREMELFRLRFQQLGQDEVSKFLELNNLSYAPISNDEKETIRNNLIESTMGLSDVSVDTTSFYKVHFTEVNSLVHSRRVFLHKSFAYIPSNELIVCVLTAYRVHLNEALAYTNNRLPHLNDDRLNRLLDNLHNSYTGKEYTVQTEKDGVNIADLDLLAKNHFPPCMSYIHQVLRSTHEMKYGCRLQYGLFLKGIGVTLENAITFWRDEFTKVKTEKDFEKHYLYSIKHIYGKVGRMQSKAPYNCMKIIMSDVGPGQCHGCPFKHWDQSILKQKLAEAGISTMGINEITELLKNQHYQLACGKYFDYTHGQPNKIAIEHPNQYYEASRKIPKKETLITLVPDVEKIFETSMEL